MDQQSRILIVDDDPGIRKVIGKYFVDHGFEVTTAESAAAMRRELACTSFDAIVLDVMMPGEDGLTALSSIRLESRPPIVMLSVLGTDTDRIIGIELGADDYMAKPCNPRELLARVRAVIRRSRLAPITEDTTSPTAQKWCFDGWTLDYGAWSLQAPNGTLIETSTHEFRLMHALVQRAGRLASRNYLIEMASGVEADSFDRAIDVAISRLRRKLLPHGGENLIKTVRGEGYMLAVVAQRMR
jgi:two-component system OmpR family response regulator